MIPAILILDKKHRHKKMETTNASPGLN